MTIFSCFTTLGVGSYPAGVGGFGSPYMYIDVGVDETGRSPIGSDRVVVGKRWFRCSLRAISGRREEVEGVPAMQEVTGASPEHAAGILSWGRVAETSQRHQPWRWQAQSCRNVGRTFNILSIPECRSHTYIQIVLMKINNKISL
jgi:hypothetical protein